MSYEISNLDSLLVALRHPRHANVNLEAIGPVCSDIVMRLNAIAELLVSKDNVIYLLGHKEDRCIELDHHSIADTWKDYVKTPPYAEANIQIQQKMSLQISAYKMYEQTLNIVCSKGDDFDMILIRTRLVRTAARKYSRSYDDAVKMLLKALHQKPIVAFDSFLNDLLSETATTHVELRL